MAETEHKLYCGTSNVVLPVPNKTHFPPVYRDKSRLHYYASMYNSVEINSSFKKIPRTSTVEKWTSEVPDHFRFTFKLWSGITHAKELGYDVSDIGKFLEPLSAVGDKKGCLLIQFPASIKISYFQKLKRLLSDIVSEEQAEGLRLAIEFRDVSWYKEKVYEMLEHYNAAVVKHDMPKSSTPFTESSCSFEYLRFHGENGRYRGSYDKDVLKDYTSLIKEWKSEGKPVFVYFNNTLGAAAHNALDLKGLTQGE